MQFGRRSLYLATTCACAALLASHSLAQIKAFPEAEGFGAYATGARTNLASASVYHVTNLNDSGAGSFRDAVSQPNRFVVFDVSGVAQLLSTVSVQDNVTIAGQTAPGGGFTLYGAKVSYTDANNSITRYLRVRKGHTTGRDDAVSIADGTNMIFDHLSVTWGNDETFSMNPSTGATIDKITIQNSIIGQGLDNVNHSAGGLMTIDGSFSILRSLFIDNETRNPKVRGTNQFVNNVVYNWLTAAYIMGDTSGESKANVIGNYMIQGPTAGGSPFSSGTPTFEIFADNNFYDSNRNGALDGALHTSYPGSTIVAGPHAMPAVNVDSPQKAYERIVAQVGPSLYRDEVDTRMIQELSSLGTLGQIVLTEESLFPSWPGALPSPPRPTDTDNDGMPDSWETARGLNPTNAADWKNIGITGYTRLEEYVNELGVPHASKIWTASSGNWSTAGSWSGGLPTWDDNAYIRGAGVGTNGNAQITGLGAQAFRVFVGGNGAATGETLTVTSGGTLKVMDYVHVGYENNATLTINSGASVETSAVLLGTTSFNGNLVVDGGTLTTGVIAHAGGTGTVQLNAATIRANGWLNFTANASIGSGGLIIDGNSAVGTISGNLSGTGGLTARGNGTISLTGTNTYLGATVLEGGSTGITTDANIGGATVPITFAGGMLRINGTTLTNINSHPVNWSTFNGGFDIASSANTFTVANNISGSGSVTKGGAGMLVLSGSNNFTGGVTMYGGTLSVSSNANLGANGSPLTFAGGALRVTGSSLLNLDNHPLAGGTVGGTLDIQSTQPFAINQVINGSGSLTKAGSGTLVLARANAFSGNLFIKGGAVRLGDAWGIRYMTLNLDTAGTTFDVNGYNALIGGLAGNQNFDLKGKTPEVGKSNLDTTFSGTISDSIGGGTFKKIGTGTLTLTGNSTGTVPIAITGGRINIPTLGNYGIAGPLGAGSDASSLILDGGVLRHYGAGVTTNRLFTLGVNGGTLNGAGTGGWGWNSTGSIAFSGTGNRTLYLEGSQAGNSFSFLLTDPVGGKLTLYKTGNSRWLVSGTQTHTYSGDTYINSGTLLQFGGANLLPYGTGKGNLFINAAAQYDMNGNDLRINALTGAGNLNQRGSTSRTLTLGYGDASGTFSGTITATALSGQGTLNIVKTGTGMQIFSGANSYNGTTTVSAGVLQFNTAGSIGGTGASVTVNSPGGVAAGYAMDQAFLGRIAPASTGAVLLAANSGNALNLNTAGLSGVTIGALGNITYSGLLTPHATPGYTFGGGNGALTFSAVNAITGARNVRVASGTTISFAASNDYTGTTTIASGGVLSTTLLANGGGVSGIGASSSAAANLILDGGTLRGGGTTDRLFTITANGGTLDGSNAMTFNGVGAPALTGSGDRTLTLTGTSTSNNFFIDLTDSPTTKLSLQKRGTGRWFVGGNLKTFSGDTIVNGGTLHTNAAVLPSGAGRGNVIVTAGTLNLGNNTTTLNGLSGAGIVDQGGTNTRSLTLGGNNADGNFTGTINGSGVFSVNKTGSGSQTLSGSLNFGGNLSVSDGTLIVSKLPTATINVTGGLLQQLARPTRNDPAAVSIINALNITGGAFDLSNNGLIINYSAASPIESIRGFIAASQLISSTNSGSLTLGYGETSIIGTTPFVGITTDTTAIVIETAVTGDTNLNGTVDSTDFNSLLAGYGSQNGVWTSGDFSFDGKVNTLDFNLLAGSFGLALPGNAPSLGAVVPEPASMTLVMISALSMTSRTRRKKKV